MSTATLATPIAPAPAYGEDLDLWLHHQLELIAAGRLRELDVPNLTLELEGLEQRPT